jgi:hypothetical protein
VPVSGLTGPDVSEVRTNDSPPVTPFTWMATRCFAVAEPADATAVNVTVATARAASVASFVSACPQPALSLP